MAAYAHTPARLDDAPGDFGELLEDVFFLQEPARPAPPCLPVDLFVRRETAELGVVVRILPRIVIILPERPAVGDQERRCVGDLRLGGEADDVLVERKDGQGVLLSGVPVDHHSEVVFQVEAAFGRRHQPLLLRRHEDPLPPLGAWA